MKGKVIVPVVLFLAVIFGCSVKENIKDQSFVADDNKKQEGKINSAVVSRKRTIYIKDNKLNVEIADTGGKKEKGLMFRESLPSDEGMLFVYSEDDYLRFWMKNTKIPLTIAFIDKNGIITEIADMKPNDLTTIESKYKVRYALEVNKGYFQEHKIKPGDKVTSLN